MGLRKSYLLEDLYPSTRVRVHLTVLEYRGTRVPTQYVLESAQRLMDFGLVDWHSSILPMDWHCHKYINIAMDWQWRIGIGIAMDWHGHWC